uniref:DNA-directed RNA polymerase M/15kDa subunit domain-containing protein n=1 Tax=viral metagenome TaxID=1070528 RepID=A0A6C0EK66_9ZZZZ
MNFCQKCEFMVYTKLSTDSKSLINYCKNCSWEGEYLNTGSDETILVNKNNYNKEYISDKYILNKYTTKDPTLPRINNIPCINNKCLTNLDVEEKTLIVKQTDLEELTNIITAYNVEKSNFDIISINDEQVLITFKLDEDLDKLRGKEIIINDTKLICNTYIKPAREIIFIKYDTLNMKYLYLCSVCSTSWKNE